MGPDGPSMHVSHETIHAAIDAHVGGELRRQVIACPRQGSPLDVHGEILAAHAQRSDSTLR